MTTEIQHGDIFQLIQGKTVFGHFKEGLQRTEIHHIKNDGLEYEADSIKWKKFSRRMKGLLGHDLGSFDEINKKILRFTANHSELFSGIKSRTFYKENKQKIIAKNVHELTDLMNQLTLGNKREIKVAQKMLPVFDDISQEKISRNKLISITKRGFENARLCEVCEQVDPVLGGMIHVAANLLTVKIKPKSLEGLSNFWKDQYLEGVIPELSSPKITGVVDIFIKTVELNQERYPNLADFFGSQVNIGNFKGTYFDMVDVPDYK